MLIVETYLKRILQTALRSPSGDNCQPFRFKVVSKDAIEIYHSEEAAKHSFNSENYASLIALGTTIESMAIEARGLGFKPITQLTKDLGSTEQHHWATFRIAPSEKAIVDPLIGQFDTRWTCRYPYTPDPLPREIVQECKIQAQIGSSSVSFFHEKPVTAEFFDYLQKTDLFLWAHKEAAIDLLKKMRFTQQNDSPYGDGMSGFELGIKSHEMLLLRFLQKHPSFIRFFFMIGLKKTSLNLTIKNYMNCAGLFAFSVPVEMDPKVACVDAGRSAIRVWMYLNKMGYLVQPMTTASLLCFQNRNKTISPFMKPEYKAIFSIGTKLWKKYFGVSEGSDVIWALRVGKASNSLQQHRSKRLKLEDLLISS